MDRCFYDSYYAHLYSKRNSKILSLKITTNNGGHTMRRFKNQRHPRCLVTNCELQTHSAREKRQAIMGLFALFGRCL